MARWKCRGAGYGVDAVIVRQVDPARVDVLLERFVSPARNEPSDSSSTNAVVFCHDRGRDRDRQSDSLGSPPSRITA
jgi:hypothetical protein